MIAPGFLVVTNPSVEQQKLCIKKDNGRKLLWIDDCCLGKIIYILIKQNFIEYTQEYLHHLSVGLKRASVQLMSKIMLMSDASHTNCYCSKVIQIPPSPRIPWLG